MLFLNDENFSLFRFWGATIFFVGCSILENSVLANYLPKNINFKGDSTLKHSWVLTSFQYGSLEFTTVGDIGVVDTDEAEDAFPSLKLFIALVMSTIFLLNSINNNWNQEVIFSS